jgi:hypothetical protein
MCPLSTQRHWFDYGEEIGVEALLHGLSQVPAVRRSIDAQFLNAAPSHPPCQCNIVD